MKKTTILYILFLGVLSFIACSKEDEGGNATKVSSYGSQQSHNMGRNCMDCHASGSSGEGWFNVAGTVYDSLLTSTLPNGTIYFYTDANATGTLKYTIQVDAKGNFYTTNNIDFSTALYPVVKGKSSNQMMSSGITTGQCNSCHGVSTDKIWTK